jgi:hypothetical protein
VWMIWEPALMDWVFPAPCFGANDTETLLLNQYARRRDTLIDGDCCAKGIPSLIMRQSDPTCFSI